MSSKLNPYISFQDNARKAMEFYKTVFGGKLMTQTFKEGSSMPGAEAPANDDRLMHAMLETDNGMTLMAADTPEGMEYRAGSSISLSLSGDNEAELRGYYEKLADGGKTTMPLDKAPWGDIFGMVTDKFGINWLVNISMSSPDA